MIPSRSNSSPRIIVCSSIALVMAACNPITNTPNVMESPDAGDPDGAGGAVLPDTDAGDSDGAGGAGGAGGQPIPMEDVCGDAVITGTEACDDGNVDTGDGCGANCIVEVGYACTGEPSICTDIDECLQDTDNCDSLAMCTNTIGGFMCTCYAGYMGDGVSCVDVDECAMNIGCVHQSCTNTAGSFECGACLDGFADCDPIANGCETNLNGSQSCDDCVRLCNGGLCTCIAVANDTAAVGWQSYYNCGDTCLNGYMSALVARADGSAVAVGTYSYYPWCGLPGGAFYNWFPVAYDDSGPHPFRFDIDAAGTIAAPQEIAHLSKEIHYQPWRSYTYAPSFPELWSVAGGVGSFQSMSYDIYTNTDSSSTCMSSTLSTPGYVINPGCELKNASIVGNDAGIVVARHYLELTTFDGTGQTISSVPDPFGPKDAWLALGPQNELYAGRRNADMSIWIAKGTTSGILEWQKTISASVSSSSAQMFALDVDADGNLLLAINSDTTIDFGNGPIPNIGSQDLILAKLDPQGNALWTKRYGGPEFKATSVRLRRTATHDFAILLHFSGALDLGDRFLGPSPIVAKFDASGTIVWHARTAGELLSGHPGGAVYVGNFACGFGVTRYEP